MISSVTHPTTSTESCCGIDRNPSASRNIFLFDLRNSIFGVDFSGIERQYLTLPNTHLPRPTGELTEAFGEAVFPRRAGWLLLYFAAVLSLPIESLSEAILWESKDECLA